jgi:aspartate kinase
MVVQKFGGTSVADPEAIRRLIEIVRTARARDGRGPAVVVSAMSKVTDTASWHRRLRRRVEAGGRPLTGGAGARAPPGGRAEVAPADAAGTLGRQIHEECDSLAAVVKALAVLNEATPRTLDVVAAMGEMLSSRLVAAALTHAGVPAEWVDARRAIVTDDEHMRATPLMEETVAALRARCCRRWSGARAGAGRLRRRHADGRTTTLGRGGSDYSGALVAPASARTRSRSGPTWTA